MQKFKAYKSPTFVGGADPMVAYHWFQQVDKILEAMEITANVTKIRLVMTWKEFQELFMNKYFSSALR